MYLQKHKNDVGEDTEMLPDGWNATPNLYILRYKYTTTSEIYIFKVLAVDNSLLVHFWVNILKDLQCKQRYNLQVNNSKYDLKYFTRQS